MTDAKIEARRAKERMVKMRIEMDELRPKETSTAADGDFVAAVREELTKETTVVPGALALSPDQVLLPQTPEESEHKPTRAQAPPAANPFAAAAAAETGKENVATPKGTKPSARPRARINAPPLSPLSLLNIR